MNVAQEKYPKEILEIAKAHGCNPALLIVDDDCGALVPVEKKPLTVEWKRWRSANGYVASFGNEGMEFPNVTTRAQKKALRFHGEKLPYVFFQPWETLVKVVAAPIRWFINRFDPQPVQHSFGCRVIE